jgi:branched-chain amino acid aminotransferase
MAFPLTVQKVAQSRLPGILDQDFHFGQYYADHMFMADYEDGVWSNCRIVPYENISVSPATNSLHYGQMIFEGLKAYRHQNGEVFLFRPGQNLARFNISAARMAMPAVPEEIWYMALNELLSIDKDWVPDMEGYSLYVRPFMFATDEFIGIRPTNKFKFMVICSPAGMYYSKPVKVWVSDHYVRAFPGGTGFAKAAGNYAACVLPMKEANQKGFDQVLWVDGVEFKYIQEIGTMNVFVVIDGKVYTPELDGSILNGVTRDSVIALLKSEGYSIAERKISVDDIIEAGHRGVLDDAFGTGTAANIAPIAAFGIKDHILELPQEHKVSTMLKEKLDGIKYGKMEDPNNWLYKVQPAIVGETVAG